MAKTLGSYGNVIKSKDSVNSLLKGNFFIQNGIRGIVAEDTPRDQYGPIIIRGVVKMKPVNVGTTVAIGAKLYSGNRLDTWRSSPSGSHIRFIGYALESSDNTSSEAIDVLLSMEGENT